MKSIRKAIFPVAGFGTRFLPATKAMPKELMPIVDRPLIQYAVEEAILAGIDTLIFITGRNKRAIEDHFDVNLELEGILRKKGKNEQADMVRNVLPEHVECIFVRQPEQLGLGHAVLCAERALGGDDFAVLLADDFITFEGMGVTSDLIKAYNVTKKSQLSALEVNGPDISKYGVLKLDKYNKKLSGIIEKPSYGDAPSSLASIGRYVLTSDIFDILRVQKAGVGGEIQLTDAINQQAISGGVDFVTLKGERFDCGSRRGYLDAIFHTAKKLGLRENV